MLSNADETTIQGKVYVNNFEKIDPHTALKLSVSLVDTSKNDTHHAISDIQGEIEYDIIAIAVGKDIVKSISRVLMNGRWYVYRRYPPPFDTSGNPVMDLENS